MNKCLQGLLPVYQLVYLGRCFFFGGGQGALPYKPIRGLPFLRVSFYNINS